MKSDRVFVAFLKSDNEEHLLYKKSEDNYYYDLNTKEKIYADDIDFNTLIYLKDSIYFLGDNVSKRTVKKIYNDDRKKLIDTQKLVIADIKQVDDYEIINLGNQIIQYKWKSKQFYKTILQRYISNVYEDIRNGKIYIGELPDMFINGNLYVEDAKDNNMKYLRYEYPQLGSIEKKKVLELAYKVSKGKDI